MRNCELTSIKECECDHLKQNWLAIDNYTSFTELKVVGERLKGGISFYNPD